MLPKSGGRQLPDIDVLLRGSGAQTLVIVEIKWQLSAADTKEVIARNDYLQKGQSHLLLIKEFLLLNPSYLRERGLIDNNISNETISCLLLCKGHLGSADIIATHSVMADYDVFVGYLAEGSFESALNRVMTYDYLPIPDRDFVVDQVGVNFGDYKIKWKSFRPPTLIPDEETQTVQDFYDATGPYIF